MENIESLRERIEVLEHHTEAVIHRSHLIERRLRWWRVLACGSLVVGVVSLPLPSGTAQEDYSERGLSRRLAALEYKLQYISGGPNEVVITGANLRILNGLGATDTTNGLGNLIVGYEESRQELAGCPGSTASFCTDTRTGSHNVVVGRRHNFSSFGGLVVGEINEISAEFASVSGGSRNIASGNRSSVSGGFFNSATTFDAWVSGGGNNTASGTGASVSGGFQNEASGNFSSVSGGESNGASAFQSSIIGGQNNRASGNFSSVCGGNGVIQTVEDGWAAGSFGGLVSGRFRSP